MKMCRNLFLLSCLSLVLTALSVFGDEISSVVHADKNPLINLKQFQLPPNGIGYHTHDCSKTSHWTLCKVYEIQEDKQLRPYSGQLNWEVYDSNGKMIFNSCCTEEEYVKIRKNFMNPGDVYFIIAIKDGEVLFAMPHIEAESNVPHFSTIPIWTYSNFAQWCPLYYEFCLNCNELQSGDFSKQSIAKNGPRLHDTLNIYVPAKSSVVVSKSSLVVADIPVFYVRSNEELSAHYKTMKYTDETGVVDFRVHREKDDLGLYALYGGCLHPSIQNPDCEGKFEIKLPNNTVTLVLRKGDDVLPRRKVIICDANMNASISVADLMSDELGQVKFTPPLDSQYRILVFDAFPPLVSMPIQASATEETIIFDIAGINEEGDKEAAIASSPINVKNTDQPKSRLVFAESHQFLKDINLTAELGRLVDKSKTREFNVHKVLSESRAYIEDTPTLMELFFFERILYSQYYTELYEHTVTEKQNVKPTFAPSIP